VNIMDIREPSGPYWEAYQATRARDHIFDNPAFTPTWFLEKLAHGRIAAARVELEKLGARNSEEAWRALRILEKFLRGGGNPDEREAIVAGLLGAEEIEIERERRE
jgi:hypothetical protein